MTRPRPLLYRRGFYLLLGGFVVLLYGFLWVHPAPSATDRGRLRDDSTGFSRANLGGSANVRSAWGGVKQLDEETAFTLDSAKVLEALRRDEGLARLLNLWGLVALLLLASGLGLSAQALYRRTALGILRNPESHLPGTWSLSDVGRLVLLVVLVVSLLPFVQMGLMVWTGAAASWTSSHLWSLVSMFLIEGWVVLLVWGLASAKSRSLSSMLGFSRHRSLHTMEQAMAGYITCFPWLMGLLWAIIVLCERWHIQPPLEPIHELLFLERSPLVVGLTVVLACVVGPVVEEIFFRGVLFTALRKRSSRAVAMLVSSSGFAAAHTNAVGFLPILLLGCLLADRYERSGSLWAPIVVHVFHNSLLIGVALTLKALL